MVVSCAVVVVEVGAVVDVVVGTAVSSVVDDAEDEVVLPTVVVVAISVAQAPVMISKATPAASRAHDLISGPLDGVLSLPLRRIPI